MGALRLTVKASRPNISQFKVISLLLPSFLNYTKYVDRAWKLCQVIVKLWSSVMFFYCKCAHIRVLIYGRKGLAGPAIGAIAHYRRSRIRSCSDVSWNFHKLFKPYHPSNDVSDIHKVRQSPDFEPLKLWNVQSCRISEENYCSLAHSLPDRPFYNFKAWKFVDRYFQNTRGSSIYGFWG